MSDVKLALSGLRGESFADVARRVGTFGGLPVSAGSTDAEVLDLLEDRVAEIVAAGGFSMIAPVVAATTANITLSGAQTIDGVAVVATDRVLVKNQTASAENGIWIAAAGAWSRATDFNETSEVVKGAYVFTTSGNTQGSAAWVLATANPITVGTTAQSWILFRDFSAANLNWLQAGTGAVQVTGQAKLRQGPVQPNSGEFGAFTSATVTTATLLKAFTAAMADGRPIELSGHYDINGPITPEVSVNGAELRLIVKDDVTITIDAGATAFYYLLYAESSVGTPSHSISGPGTLTIDCNNKAASAIWLRHTTATTGGTVFLNAPVHVKNVKAAAGINNASGIQILGRYERVVMRSPTVEDVTRVEAAGESSGISISGFDGEVELYSPVVRRVNCGPSSTNDADCIKCFGRQSGSTNNRREGSVRIYSPVLEDSQVRLYKDQCGDTIIYSPFCRRRGVDGTVASFGAASSVDFDFQFGNGLVLDARIEYYKSATGVSPLGSSHSVFAFQQKLDNSEMYGLARGTTILTDVIIPRIVASTTNAAALAFTTELDGLTITPVASLVSGVIERSFIEFDSSVIGEKSTPSTFVVTNTRAPNSLPVIAYTGYAALVSGTATAGSSTTLTDSGKSWTTNEQAGRLVRITGGTGSGQTRTIISNTATVLTVAAAWTVTPDATSVYSIWYSFANTNLDTGTATAGGATTLTDSAKAWVTDGFVGRNVRINSGTGIGQTRRITANTATALTVSSAWSVNPDATSVYAILGPKLSISVDNCSTSMPVTGNSTRAFSNLSGQAILDPGSFMVGDNPGYRNWYAQFVCPELMQAGCKMVLYLDSDDTEFVDTDLNTAVSVPWGTSGMLFMEGKGISNYSVGPHDRIIEARLNNATAASSAWFTMNGGVNWGALN
jgi:uncharacterized cupin superfamily protein